jgi:ubiquinone/menaquinone biosynthesis C-methylase UbiE
MNSDKLKILNIGCGDEFYGTDRIDIQKTKASTKEWDIEKGIPYNNNVFDEIRCWRILEHLKNIGFFIDECYRVLKNGGRIDVITDNAGYIIFHIKTDHNDYINIKNYTENYSRNVNDHHRNLFVPSHLKYLFYNFNIISINYLITSKKRWIRNSILKLLPFHLGYEEIRLIGKKPMAVVEPVAHSLIKEFIENSEPFVEEDLKLVTEKSTPLGSGNAEVAKPVIIAGYARSGQGWLGYMLSYILNAKFIEPYCLLRGIVYSANPYIMGLTQGNLEGREKTKYSMIVKTHNLPDNYFSLTDKIIILARDPRDVAISALDRNIIREKSGTDLTVEDQTAVISRQYSKSKMERFKNWLWSKKIICYLATAIKWKKYYEGWEGVDISHKVTYEDISLYPKQTILKILRYLEVDVPESLVEDAIHKFSFEQLSGRKKGDEERSNTSFRKGVIGDHKNKISSMEKKLFKIISGKKIGKWGYSL